MATYTPLPTVVDTIKQDAITKRGAVALQDLAVTAIHPRGSSTRLAGVFVTKPGDKLAIFAVLAEAGAVDQQSTGVARGLRSVALIKTSTEGWNLIKSAGYQSGTTVTHMVAEAKDAGVYLIPKSRSQTRFWPAMFCLDPDSELWKAFGIQDLLPTGLGLQLADTRGGKHELLKPPIDGVDAVPGPKGAESSTDNREAGNQASKSPTNQDVTTDQETDTAAKKKEEQHENRP